MHKTIQQIIESKKKTEKKLFIEGSLFIKTNHLYFVQPGFIHYANPVRVIGNSNPYHEVYAMHELIASPLQEVNLLVIYSLAQMYILYYTHSYVYLFLF